MQNLNDLLLFARVVEHNGFAPASRALGIPKSRLSRRVAALEEQLGVRLLQRSSRRLALTAVGREFHDRCKQVVALGEAAFGVVHEAASEPQGPLRVSCPPTLAQAWLTPVLGGFLRAAPKVRLDLVLTNRRVDPLEDQVDVAIRVRRPPFQDSSIVVRTLAVVQDVLVASPELVGLQPPLHDVEGLGAWPALAVPDPADRHQWQLTNGKRRVDVPLAPRLVCGDMLALRQAALDAVGVALLPQLVCRADLEAGRLVRVLPEWSGDPVHIQLAFASRRGMAPSLRAFLDFLGQHVPPGDGGQSISAR